MTIPLSEPDFTNRERSYLEDVFESKSVKGDGKYCERASTLIEREFDGNEVLVTSSCTHALEMAALLLDIDENDDVVLPSYTFPSTATAFALRGANIVFCDIDDQTLNIDVDDLRNKVTEETAAIVPVHYAGVACEMDEILEIADRYDATIVEDAAQGVNAKYSDEFLGTIGDIGCYSFHGTKSYAAGEGGAILINDDQYVERAEIIRQKGTNYSKFARGEVEEYTWVDIGSSYVPSELQAALIYAQLERRDEIRERRRENFEYYLEELSPIADAGSIQLPHIPSYATTNYHIFYILTSGGDERTALVEYLNDNGVEAASHYRPLHLSDMGRSYGYGLGDAPTTKRIADQVVRLPVHSNLTEEDREQVVSLLQLFYQD